MADEDLKRAIKKAIIDFSKEPVHKAALSLFSTLGYNTERKNPFPDKSFKFFKESFLKNDTPFSEDKACVKDWNSVDLLFQITTDEVSKQNSLFNNIRVDNTIIESYLFFSVELKKDEYTRTQLAQITREINKVFRMPVLIVFKHGQTITLSVINRRLNKKDAQKDVLEKVTVIKDIYTISPHRAHIEILFDLSFSKLLRVHKFTNFVELHNAWQKTLDTKELNKRFYHDLSYWYFWALHEVHFPTTNWAADKNNLMKEEDKVKEHNAKNLIRLLTRLLFVWFVKEKNLIPEELFDESYIKDNLLNGFEPGKKKGSDHKTQGSKYYRAILQNLFFATLNQTVGKREFRKEGQQMNVTNLMRYQSYFIDPKAFINLVENIVPFMNGGLFECLDSPDPALKGKQGGDIIIYEDGFSDRKNNDLCVPDYIFFGLNEHADLSDELGDKKQKDVTVSGLINILKSYKFTVTENTPIEEDVALDPELLGRVFENLLASYNPETKTTARKQTGSFYTPREIVNYMVDESLKAYLKQKLETEAGMTPEDAETGLELLIGYNEKEHLFDSKQTTVLINAIDNCKILDPACGSGAFPMGILHKLVHILHKLDPQNKLWKERQIERAQALEDPGIRDKLIEDIETAFESNELDYGRKLYLIEKCIYGVDIQPIATQISKLRFFISLIVDQKADKRKENFGIRPLPNLETKFVAANTLIGIEKPKVGDFVGSIFDNSSVKDLESKLKDVRHRLFSAKTPASKRKLREEDQNIREVMGKILEDAGWSNKSARQLAAWDPYNQNVSSGWFDPEWMFGITDGFDVVIGNPPYVLLQDKIKDEKLISLLRQAYSVSSYKVDLYHLFYELSIKCLKMGGALSFITPSNFLSNNYTAQLRKYLVITTELRKIINIKGKVFEAEVNNAVIICTKNNKNNKFASFFSANDIFEFAPSFNYAISHTDILSSGNCLLVPMENYESLSLINKIQRNSKPLSDYAEVKFGMQLRNRKEFVTDVIQNPSKNLLTKYHKKCLTGSDINRFSVTFNNLYCYFNIEAKRGGCWDEDVHFAKNKILVRQIGKAPIAGLDEYGFPVLNSAFMVKCFNTKNSYYLLGLINSKTLQFYWQNKFGDRREQFPKIKGAYLELLPIKYSESITNKLEIIVGKVIDAKKANLKADTSEFEKQIDQLVYKLYDLTEEEIAIIENSVK